MHGDPSRSGLRTNGGRARPPSSGGHQIKVRFRSASASDQPDGWRPSRLYLVILPDLGGISTRNTASNHTCGFDFGPSWGGYMAFIVLEGRGRPIAAPSRSPRRTRVAVLNHCPRWHGVFSTGLSAVCWTWASQISMTTICSSLKGDGLSMKVAAGGHRPGTDR